MPCSVVDDGLLEVYERAAAGDVPGARSLLAGLTVPARQRAEMEAFLDGLQSGGEVETVEAVDSTLEGPTGRGAQARALEADPMPFRCLHCGGEAHATRNVLLDSALFSFLGWDAVDAQARMVSCAACGHCAWFTHAAPGALQAMARRDDPRWDLQGEGAPCPVCGFRGAVEGSAQLNTRGLTILGLDWLNRGARTESCQRCGHVRWSAPGTDPWGEPVEAAPGACRACDGVVVEERRVLLNTPLVTNLGLDWLNEGARLRACSCGALDWFVRPLAGIPAPASPNPRSLQISPGASLFMDDRLLEVYELAMMGDVEAAREMLGTIDADSEDVAEMEAFLRSMEEGGEVQEMAGADAMGGITGATPLPGTADDDSEE